MLKAFAYKLMDHVANETKVPAEGVMKAWADWDTAASETEAIRQQHAQQYHDQHDIPRIDRMTAYDTYTQQQKALKDIYLSDSTHRTTALHEWLRMTPPPILKDGVTHDELYTAFANLPSSRIVSPLYFKKMQHKNVE